MKKRILPVLLALCMVMSLLPVAFAEHTNDSCTVDGCTTEGCTGGCTKASPCQACQDANCAACQEDEEEETPAPGEDEEDEVIYCSCTSEKHKPWLDDEGVKHETCTNVVDEAGKCATCLKTASCNPCGKGGCTLLAVTLAITRARMPASTRLGIPAARSPLMRRTAPTSAT